MNDIEYKKEFLTADEVRVIRQVALEEYDKSQDKYEAILVVYACLFVICLNDYKDEDFDKYYNMGLGERMLYEIENASEALALVMDEIDRKSSMAGVVENFLKTISNALLDSKEAEKLINKISKEMEKVSDKYVQITKGEGGE